MIPLRREREILCRRLQNLESSSISADQLMKQMQTENDRLQLKIKILTSEMAKERAAIGTRQNSPDDVIWQQMKQVKSNMKLKSVSGEIWSSFRIATVSEDND